MATSPFQDIIGIATTGSGKTVAFLFPAFRSGAFHMAWHLGTRNGNDEHNYGKSPCRMGISTINGHFP